MQRKLPLRCPRFLRRLEPDSAAGKPRVLDRPLDGLPDRDGWAPRRVVVQVDVPRRPLVHAPLDGRPAVRGAPQVAHDRTLLVASELKPPVHGGFPTQLATAPGPHNRRLADGGPFSAWGHQQCQARAGTPALGYLRRPVQLVAVRQRDRVLALAPPLPHRLLRRVLRIPCGPEVEQVPGSGLPTPYQIP